MIAAFSFAAIVKVAIAGHYHEYFNVRHGFVHGSSTTDGSFHGRTDNYGGWPEYNYCAVGDTSRGLYADEWTYGTDLCNIWSGVYSGSKDECLGASANEVTGGILSYHNHYSHYYTGSPCYNA